MFQNYRDMDNKGDDGPEAKRPKLETSSNGTGQKQEEKVTISATQLFEGMLSNMPDYSKKETLNAFIQTLCKLRDKVDDPVTEQNKLKEEEVVVVDEGITNPMVLPECAQPPPSLGRPLLQPQTNGSTAPSPSKSGPNLLIKPPTPSFNKMPVLEAIPPLAPGISLRPTQSELLLRQQAHMKQQERMRLLNPNLVSPPAAESSSLMQKERAHQKAMQVTPTPPMGLPDATSVYINRLRHKILQSIHAIHNGKASEEQIQQYLKRPCFMIYENNAYTTVPNPWTTTTAQMQEFMATNGSQTMPVMLPPRPPAAPPRQMTNLLPPQLPGSMLPPTGTWQSTGSAFHQPSAFQLQQASSLMTANKGLSLPVLDMRPRKNDWSVRGIPLPTCLHIQCNCFPQMPLLPPYLPKK